MKTKSILALVSAAFACALPVAAAVDALGITLPAAFDALHIFSAFVTTMLLVTVFKDYGRSVPRFVSSTRAIVSTAPARPTKADHPLAA